MDLRIHARGLRMSTVTLLKNLCSPLRPDSRGFDVHRQSSVNGIAHRGLTEKEVGGCLRGT